MSSFPPSQSSPFELLAEKQIPALGIHALQFRHKTTGAMHLHLASEHSEQVFMVALRTMPMDSTGVAHILEHTTLCGSEQFPVRDPFFAMTRRSLNTFMNAFTAPDWTAYPFASENQQDFDNLLSVYLDAVFFPQLNYLDFRQEGHRLHWQADQPAGKRLARQGVVYNEMKGAMSSAPARIWQRLSQELFSPKSTYHYNSGGEPSQIPQLDHQQLVDFHRQHYHPSNALFMTFGNADLQGLQQQLQTRVLERFSDAGPCFQVASEFPSVAKQAQMTYPASAEQLAEGGKLAMAWLWPEVMDAKQLLSARLLNDLLLDHSGSPLRQQLETWPQAQAPLSLCGMDDSCRQMMFIVGYEGVAQTQLEEAEQSIWQCLHSIREQGFSQHDIEAALHQLELQQREISGDGFPYGLQLMMQLLPAAIHQGDCLAMLDLNQHLTWLRQQALTPGWLTSLLDQWLLNNDSRVVLHALPDVELEAAELEAELQQLAQLEAELSHEQVQQIQQEQQQLQARQEQQDDFELLPKVTSKDVRSQLRQRQADIEQPGMSFYQAGTNGLFYQSWVQGLTALPEQLANLPLYTALVTELGVGQLDYLQAQQQQNAELGSLAMHLQYRAHEQDASKARFYLALSGKALSSKASALFDWQERYLQQPRFDELARIKDLCTQIRLRKQQSLTNQGHALMMSAAGRQLSPMANLLDQWSGVQAIAQSQTWDQQIPELAASLASMHHQLWQAEGHWLQISDAPSPVRPASWCKQEAGLDKAWLALPASLSPGQPQVWLTNSSVNFSARVYAAPGLGHEDAAALWVLAAYLRNGFLHRALREQGGAYGGGASYDPMLGLFRFYSYRDIRALATFEDYQASLHWLSHHRVDPQQLDEARLSVLSSMDRPHSPAGEAKASFWQHAFDRTLAKREQLLAQVLAVSGQDLLRVAQRWLWDKPHQDAILGGQDILKPLEAHGFVLQGRL